MTVKLFQYKTFLPQKQYKSDVLKFNVTFGICRISVGYKQNDVMTFFSNFYIIFFYFSFITE